MILAKILYAKVAQLVECVTSDDRLFLSLGIGGSSPTVNLDFFLLYFVLFFYFISLLFYFHHFF